MRRHRILLDEPAFTYQVRLQDRDRRGAALDDGDRQPAVDALLGWSRTTLRAGDVITAYVYQAKSGVPVGRTNKVILADGTVLADRDDSTPSRYGTTEAPK